MWEKTVWGKHTPPRTLDASLQPVFLHHGLVCRRFVPSNHVEDLSDDSLVPLSWFHDMHCRVQTTLCVHPPCLVLGLPGP